MADCKRLKNTPATLSAIDKALRYFEARFRRLFETVQDGILLLNAETGIIEDVNPFLCEITSQRGVTLDEQVVDACLRVFHVHGYIIEE